MLRKVKDQKYEENGHREGGKGDNLREKEEIKYFAKINM